MSLPWIRIDTAFPRNHKILALVEDRHWQAITGYICGLAYSGEQGTDGLVPRGALPYIHSTPKIAGQLEAVGLWVPGLGGWEANDWAEYQPSNAETQVRSQKAREAAQARWNPVPTHAPSNANGNAPRMPDA